MPLKKQGKLMSLIQKYWKSHATLARAQAGLVQVPVVVCTDGFEMSVQASEYHYCSPRETDISGLYRSWEVGFPTAVDDALIPYCSELEKPTDTIYSYVPTAVVDAVIEKHGGLAGSGSV